MTSWHHHVKNITFDNWDTIQIPSSWEYLLNETNKDWHEFQNMTSEEWSSFHNATLQEWQTLQKEAKDEWETLSQETRDDYHAFLNATQEQWIKIRQKSETENQSITATHATKKSMIATSNVQINDHSLKIETTATKSSHPPSSIHLNPRSTLLPYDWGYGYYAYLIGISAIFMGVIILEGIDTSLMCKSAPSKLNSTFLNVGLLATLVGTVGRVLGDGMITLGALFGCSESFQFIDFVNLLFMPLIPITFTCYYLAKKFQWTLK
jgi:hypothetical protein